MLGFHDKSLDWKEFFVIRCANIGGSEVVGPFFCTCNMSSAYPNITISYDLHRFECVNYVSLSKVLGDCVVNYSNLMEGS